MSGVGLERIILLATTDTKIEERGFKPRPYISSFFLCFCVLCGQIFLFIVPHKRSAASQTAHQVS